jgi:uncharacterized protein YecT (DUF1311 family)
MTMPRPLTLLLGLLAAQLLPLQGAARAAEPPCTHAKSTVESTRCLKGSLEAADRRLEAALADVARQAADVPVETFHTLWRDGTRARDGFAWISAATLVQHRNNGIEECSPT